MTFFRFLFIIAILVVLLTAAGATIVIVFGKEGALSALSTFVSGVRETKKFSDLGLRVSFTYPSDWKKEYLSYSLVRFWNEQSTMILEVEKMEKDKTRSLEEYTKENLREIAESAENDGIMFVLKENKDAPLGNKPGRRIKSFLGKEETVAPVAQVWAIDKDTVYSLSFSSALNEYERTVQFFENVIQSFEIK